MLVSRSRRVSAGQGVGERGDVQRRVRGGVPLVDAVRPGPPLHDAGPAQVGHVRQRLVDRELALVREDRLGDEQVGELDDRARLLADRPADLLQAPHLGAQDRLDASQRVGEGRAVAGQHLPRPQVRDGPQRRQVAAQRVGVEAALEGHRRGDAGQQVVAGEQHTGRRGPQAEVAERVARRVHHLPGVATDRQLLAAAQPPRRLDDRVQVGQPAGEVVGEVAALVLGDAVVGVGVPAPGPRGVGMAVLLAVQVRHRVHRQLGAGQLHEPAGEPVVVDVRVRDHDPAHVRQRVSRSLQPGL